MSTDQLLGRQCKIMKIKNFEQKLNKGKIKLKRVVDSASKVTVEMTVIRRAFDKDENEIEKQDQSSWSEKQLSLVLEAKKKQLEVAQQEVVELSETVEFLENQFTPKIIETINTKKKKEK